MNLSDYTQFYHRAFTRHSAVVTVPRLPCCDDAEPESLPIRLGTLREQERQHNLDEQAELHTEGHVHRNTRPQRHE